MGVQQEAPDAYLTHAVHVDVVSLSCPCKWPALCGLTPVFQCCPPPCHQALGSRGRAAIALGLELLYWGRAGDFSGTRGCPQVGEEDLTAAFAWRSGARCQVHEGWTAVADSMSNLTRQGAHHSLTRCSGTSRVSGRDLSLN